MHGKHQKVTEPDRPISVKVARSPQLNLDACLDLSCEVAQPVLTQDDHVKVARGTKDLLGPIPDTVSLGFSYCLQKACVFFSRGGLLLSLCCLIETGHELVGFGAFVLGHQ